MRILPLSMLIVNVIFITDYTSAAMSFLAEDEPDVTETVLYSKFQLWSATPNSNELRRTLLNIIRDYELEIWKNSRVANSPVDFVVSPNVQEKLKMRLAEENIPFSIKITDMHTAIQNVNSNEIIKGLAGSRSANRMDWVSYHRLDDIHDYLRYISSTYPQTVRLDTIGTSYEGRPLYVVHISSGGSTTKPAIWIDGGIHAREWISPAVATYIIYQLVEVPANANLFANVDWYIMPVMNPDGYEFSHVSDRLWRKTRSHTGTDCRGVDPNRNFDIKWGGLGTSSNPCSELYRGPKAFSEVETRTTAAYIKNRSADIKLYLTLHSYGQFILIPWGYDYKYQYPADYTDMLALGKKAASKFRSYNYQVNNTVALLSPGAGGSDDWAKSIGIKYSYTIELPDSGKYGFLLPASSIMSVCEDVFPAMEVFATEIALL